MTLLPMTHPWGPNAIFTDPCMADSYMINVGKYTVRPMDPSWDLKLHKKLKGSKKVGPGKPIVTNGVRVTWAPHKWSNING